MATYIDQDSSKVKTLYFDATSSVYFYDRSEKEQKKQKMVTDQDGNPEMLITKTDPEGKTIYKNKPEGKMLSRYMFKGYYKPKYFGDIIVEEDFPEINWEISEETKQVGNFTCHLAKTTYKKRVFYAWFTYDVPVPHGPWQLGGLPGLILEAYDESKTFVYLCTKVNIPHDVQDMIVPPKDGTVISWEEYVGIHIGAEERINKWIKAQFAAKGRNPSVHISLSNFAVTKPDGLMLVEDED